MFQNVVFAFLSKIIFWLVVTKGKNIFWVVYFYRLYSYTDRIPHFETSISAGLDFRRSRVLSALSLPALGAPSKFDTVRCRPFRLPEQQNSILFKRCILYEFHEFKCVSYKNDIGLLWPLSSSLFLDIVIYSNVLRRSNSGQKVVSLLMESRKG